MRLFRRDSAPEPNPESKTYTAALPRASFTKREALTNCFRVSTGDWEEIETYDIHGPIIGNYLWMIHDDIAKLKLVPEIRWPGSEGWVSLHDNSRLAEFDLPTSWLKEARKSADEIIIEVDMRALAFHARCLAQRGLAYIIKTGDTWRAFHPKMIVWDDDDNKSGTVSVGTKVYRFRIGNDAFVSINPHPSDFNLPYSEVIRAIPHVREFISAKRRQKADVDSIELGDIIQLPPGERVDPLTGVESNSPNSIPKLGYQMQQAAINYESRPYHEAADAISSLPLILESEQPMNVNPLLRKVDPGAFTLEKTALENIATELKVPNELLLKGPGSAKYNNEGPTRIAFLNQVVVPYIELVLTFWNPWIWQDLFWGMMSKKSPLDGFQFRINYSLDDLMPKNITAKDIHDGYLSGAVTRQEYADFLGTEILDIGELSEVDFLKVVLRARNAVASTTQGRPSSGPESNPQPTVTNTGQDKTAQ